MSLLKIVWLIILILYNVMNMLKLVLLLALKARNVSFVNFNQECNILQFFLSLGVVMLREG